METTTTGGASGHETDKRSAFSPPNTLLLAKGENPDQGGSEIVVETRSEDGRLVMTRHVTTELVDGARITTPDTGMWDPVKREWVVENYGVDPDIEVENTPSEVVAGHDPQLERAIQWTLEELQKNPPQRPERPPYKMQEGLR